MKTESIIVVTAWSCFLLGLIGCQPLDKHVPQTTFITDHTTQNIQKITVEGHEYLIVIQAGIIHSESCPCRKL